MSNRAVKWLNASREDGEASRPRAFSDFAETPNLILLGDPGAGKTHLFREAALASGGQYLTTRDFLNVPQSFLAKCLFIDALDERRAGRGDHDTVDRVIQKLFALAPLRVRIACRAQDWLGDTDLAAFNAYFDANGGVAVLALQVLSDDEQRAVLLTLGLSAAESMSLLADAQQRGLREFTLNPQNLIMLAQSVKSGRWPSTRRELFELSSQLLLSEANTAHMRAGLGVFSSDELREAAGALCAVRLVSDAVGISLREGGGGPDHPSYRSLGFLDPVKAEAAVQRRVFVTGAAPETVDYTHRTTAEYLGAEWIARQVRGGLPIGRVRALIGVDGHPASELRGLHAWLAVMLPEYAGALIDADPYGVLTYADAASLSPAFRRRLLDALAALSAKDPWFRGGRWESPALGMLARPDMVESFREVLRSEGANFGLRSVVVDAIALGAPLPELLPEMTSILEQEHLPYAERLHAAIALERFGEKGIAVLVAFGRARGRHSTASLRLRSHIINQLYSTHFAAIDVSSVLEDALGCPEELGIAALWTLDRAIPDKDIPAVLDALRPITREEYGTIDRRGRWEVAGSIERLIVRHLRQSAKLGSGAQFWRWLCMRRSLRSEFSTTFAKDIGPELRNRPDELREIVEASFGAVAEGANPFGLHRDIQTALCGAIDDETLVRWILAYLPRAASESPGEATFFELALWLCMRDATWCDASFEELTKLADARPHLQKIRERYLSAEIPDWQRLHSEATIARATKRDQDLVEARGQFAAGVDGVRNGEDLGRLAWAAGVYFGDFQDIDLSLPPVERLRRTFGEENASAAIEGFVAMLGRSDLPSLNDVVALAAQRRQHTCATSLLAGMDTIWERSRDFAGFHDDLLRVMLALHLVVPLFEDRNNAVRERELGWPGAVVDRRPDLARDAYIAVARAQLASGEQHIDGLHKLLHDPALAEFRDDVAFGFLEEFPAAASVPLAELLDHGMRVMELRSELVGLVRRALDRLTDGPDAPRDIWLSAGYLTSPAEFQADFGARALVDPAILWVLRNAVGYEHGPVVAFELSVAQLEFLTRLIGSRFPQAGFPGQAWWGAENAWNASEFVRALIGNLAVSPLSAAGEALARLVADSSMASYRDALLHARSDQGVRRREVEFLQPDWFSCARALDNGAPASVADLCALVEAHLRDLNLQIGSANTDIYKQFWNEDSHGRPISEKVEESCRDALLTLIRPKLLAVGMVAEPEGHMASDRRADIAVSMPAMKVVIELKRDSHADVWNAAETQLDRFYSRDPEARGFGIYGVFWFGEQRKNSVRKSPDGLIPQTAMEMEKMLRTRLPETARTRLDVVVFDVSGA